MALELFLIGQAKPHRNRSEHARFVNWFAVRAESKGRNAACRRAKMRHSAFDLFFEVLVSSVLAAS